MPGAHTARCRNADVCVQTAFVQMGVHAWHTEMGIHTSRAQGGSCWVSGFSKPSLWSRRARWALEYCF